MDYKKYWNNVYSRYDSKKPEYDNWLDRYENLIVKAKDMPIIDLGCGKGNNSLYLAERGCKVISCDISEVALDNVSKYVPQAYIKCLNMLEGLPFKESCTYLVIADLCLHYFCLKDTRFIINEIQRVLRPGGYLLCRLNSIRDYNHKAGGGEIIEESYYRVDDGNTKRFFDEEAIKKLFEDWQIRYLREYEMLRYEYPKMLWEVAANKQDIRNIQ